MIFTWNIYHKYEKKKYPERQTFLLGTGVRKFKMCPYTWPKQSGLRPQSRKISSTRQQFFFFIWEVQALFEWLYHKHKKNNSKVMKAVNLIIGSELKLDFNIWNSKPSGEDNVSSGQVFDWLRRWLNLFSSDQSQNNVVERNEPRTISIVN